MVCSLHAATISCREWLQDIQWPSVFVCLACSPVFQGGEGGVHIPEMEARSLVPSFAYCVIFLLSQAAEMELEFLLVFVYVLLRQDTCRDLEKLHVVHLPFTFLHYLCLFSTLPYPQAPYNMSLFLMAHSMYLEVHSLWCPAGACILLVIHCGWLQRVTWNPVFIVP